MKASAVWLLLAIAAFFFAAVLYAIYRGRDVRALLKIPFAALSFETREPGSSERITVAEIEAQSLQLPDSPDTRPKTTGSEQESDRPRASAWIGQDRIN